MPGKKLTTREGDTVEIPKVGAVKALEKPEDLHMFRCAKIKGRVRKKECGNVHFRHAGYVQALIPWMSPDKEAKVQNNDHQVMVCTKCKTPYIFVNETMYDIGAVIDVKAWEKTEKEMQAATGPGGEC